MPQGTTESRNRCSEVIVLLLRGTTTFHNSAQAYLCPPVLDYTINICYDRKYLFLRT